ncbi:1687_t:CDS:2, partial [Rhizophagus irregularis]
MSKQIQKSSILIPQNIEIGKLIGREGRNLKPISEKTVKYRFSTVKEKEKTETSLITANIINEDLPEKFSQAIFKERRNKDMIKKLPISDDRMCWYGANCKKNFCRFKHPQYIIDHHLILKYKKEIETKKHKRDFKKESRIFLHKYRNRELLKKFLK